jgi:hypothetical protein
MVDFGPGDDWIARRIRTLQFVIGPLNEVKQGSDDGDID